MKKQCKYFPNNHYTQVFIRPLTVTKLKTLGQLRNRSVARLNVHIVKSGIMTVAEKFLKNIPQMKL